MTRHLEPLNSKDKSSGWWSIFDESERLCRVTFLGLVVLMIWATAFQLGLIKPLDLSAKAVEPAAEAHR